MTAENKENEPQIFVPQVGCVLYIEPGEINNQNKHDQVWTELATVVEEFNSPLEVQYECRYDEKWYKSLAGIFEKSVGRLSVHGPIKGRDIASADPVLANWSIEENKRALDLAAALHSKSFILHITPHDDFLNRDAQRQRGMAAFTVLARYAIEKQYAIEIADETLEFPKWPSDLLEAKNIFTQSRNIYPNTTHCLDIAHLWHNWTCLKPETYGVLDFPEYLNLYLSEIEGTVPVTRFHFAGAYVEKNGEGERHETHAVPGLVPGEKFIGNNKLYFDSPPPGFNGMWLEIDPVLETVVKFTQRQKKKDEAVADVILEVHVPDIRFQFEVTRIVQDRLDYLARKK